MSLSAQAGLQVHGSVDCDGRLIEADPALAGLHERAGGRPGGVLAIPQVAALARLALRLGTAISRGAIAADGERDLDLWVRAEPEEERVRLSIGGWTERPAHRPPTGIDEGEADFVRACVDWVWETDETLRLTMVSAAATACLGRPAADMAGQPLTGLFRFCEHEDGALPILAALAERSRFDDQLAELRGGSGQTYRLSGVPLIDGTGRFAGFRGSATTVAGPARPRAANDLEASPEPHEQSPFEERLDGALRSPLHHIVSNAESIAAQGDGPLAGDYRGYAVDIASAGRHLLSLVDDLVDLQAIEGPDFAPAREAIDLGDIVRQAAALLAPRAKERSIHIDLPDQALKLPATAERKRVLQILVNLLTNAIRYSPEGTQVAVSAACRDRFASVSVSDKGKGIAQADQARIFEKFERVDALEAGGTGLGLYIARRLARAMGGDLAVESAPGAGARFTLELPLR